jgi:hypothetical protein
MSFAGLVKVFDTVAFLTEAARRFKAPNAPRPSTDISLKSSSPALTGQVEARLTGVVVAALKEAFDRDHARLELERAQLDEQRRRAEEALRAEIRRQAADREVARLRLVAGTAMGGFIAAVAMMALRLDTASALSRGVGAFGWLLLLAAVAAAFMSQARVSASVPGVSEPVEAGRAGTAALWLLLTGLACAPIALLL